MSERARQEAQRALDGARSARERNRLGQFATPPALARSLLRLGLAQLPPEDPVRFLDPALGTGTFFSALLAERGERALARAVGVELDPAVAAVAHPLWVDQGLTVREADFTRLRPEPAANLLVANPPYVRHHHLGREEKAALAARVRAETGLRPSGLMGLYGYFLLLSRGWMAPGGTGVWLIPAEFMDVRYGAEIRRFLCTQLTLIRVHRADAADLQFEDALVSSAVLVLQNRPPGPGHRARFTQGGSLEAPARERWVELEALAESTKWSSLVGDGEASADVEGARLGELFEVRRGVATGGNALFVLDEARVGALEVPRALLRPLLPPPRRLRVDRVEARPDGDPDLPERSWLLSCALPEDELARQHPALWRYLSAGVPQVSTGYLCSRRQPWYAQEARAPAPLLCTYMGRGRAGRPFRFILNRSAAIATNVYLLLYPRPALSAAMAADPGILERVWGALGGLDPGSLTREGRVYGGGLYKLEPAELAAVRLPREILEGRAAGPRLG